MQRTQPPSCSMERMGLDAPSPAFQPARADWHNVMASQSRCQERATMLPFPAIRVGGSRAGAGSGLVACEEGSFEWR
jgi:hypothetical protein